MQCGQGQTAADKKRRDITLLLMKGRCRTRELAGDDNETQNSRGRTLRPRTRRCHGPWTRPSSTRTPRRALLPPTSPLSFSRRQSAGARVDTADMGDATYVFWCPINALSRSVDEELAPSVRSGIGMTRTGTGTAGRITMTDGCGPHCSGSGGLRMSPPNEKE